jgi:hypothetical protein
MYGSAPADDEAEISIFGPGFGEAIAVHLGDKAWLLVDSCIDPAAGKPATAAYLDSIGVSTDAVRVVVASHWHDDHVRGLAALLAAYPAAELQVSSVFNDGEALAFLAAYGGTAAPTLTGGTKELFAAIAKRETVSFIHQRSNIAEVALASTGHTVRISAFSPTPGAIAATLARMASYIPQSTVESPIEHAPDLAPNAEAVAIHIDWGDHSALLGSDLEGAGAYGWQAVVSDTWCAGRRRAAAYKVAHHGSKSGDHPSIWQKLLESRPVAALTPFIRGRHRLPTEEDRVRIAAVAGSAHITSGATRKPNLASEQLKRLNQLCVGLARANPGFGAVRLRKSAGQSVWRIEYFGDAAKL